MLFKMQGRLHHWLLLTLQTSLVLYGLTAGTENPDEETRSLSPDMLVGPVGSSFHSGAPRYIDQSISSILPRLDSKALTAKWFRRLHREGFTSLLLGVVAAAMVTLYLLVTCFQNISGTRAFTGTARRLGDAKGGPSACVVSSIALANFTDTNFARSKVGVDASCINRRICGAAKLSLDTLFVYQIIYVLFFGHRGSQRSPFSMPRIDGDVSESRNGDAGLKGVGKLFLYFRRSWHESLVLSAHFLKFLRGFVPS